MKLFWLGLLPLALPAQTFDGRVSKAVAALEPKLVETRRDFHMHPELSNREVRTAKVVADRLRALGLDVRTGIAKHGVIGLLKGGKPGPVVAWRADMDALPIQPTIKTPYRSQNDGVHHACGHDTHMAIALGIAEVLAGMRADVPGTVKFIFQPAEEGAPLGEEGGAALMVKEGALENPRPAAIFGLHIFGARPAGTIAYSSGPALASADEFSIKIIGKKVHATTPHLGIDPVVVAAECTLALQLVRSRRIDQTEPMVLTIGEVHGGNRSNIIADKVTMRGTLRTFNEKVREQVRSAIRQTLNGCTSAHGASFELNWEGVSYPVTFNDPALVEKNVAALKRAAGEQAVKLVPGILGSEDFSFYQKVIPGFFWSLGGGNAKTGFLPGQHTPEFDIDESSLAVGVKAGALQLLDFLARQ